MSTEDNPLVGEAAKAGKPVEVHAVAGMTSTAMLSTEGSVPGKIRAQLMQQAMSDAVLKACEDGLSLSNPEHAVEIRGRMQAARDAVVVILNEYDNEQSRIRTKGVPPPAPVPTTTTEEGTQS